MNDSAGSAGPAGKAETRTRGACVLPQPTEAEGHAQEGDVNRVEHGISAHAFAPQHAARQRETEQAR